MRVYVETNFVLELALAQEQSESCRSILSHCRAADAELIVPTYCLVEPLETLTRRGRERRRFKVDLERELMQLARNNRFAQRATRLVELAGLLTGSAAEEWEQLERVQADLLEMARVLVLDAPTLAAASRYRERYELSSQDATMSVVSGLALMKDSGQSAQSVSSSSPANIRWRLFPRSVRL
jgi:predicted nucleic acid-binding protein